MTKKHNFFSFFSCFISIMCYLCTQIFCSLYVFNPYANIVVLRYKLQVTQLLSAEFYQSIQFMNI